MPNLPTGKIWVGDSNTTISNVVYLDEPNLRLGLNTITPSQSLHVSGNARITGAIYDSNNTPGTSGQVLSSTVTGTDWVSLSEISGVDGSGTTNYVAKWSDTDTITDSVIFDNGTNVGINTTSPDSILHIFGNTASNVPRIKIEANGWSNDCRIERSSGSDGFYITNNYDTSTSTADNTSAGTSGVQIARGDLRFHTGASGAFTERMRIDSSGRVGIGTSSFGTFDMAKIKGTNSVANDLTLIGPATSQVRINFGDTDATQQGEVGYDNSTDSMRFVTNGVERMRIDSSGRVGINKTPSTEKLEVNGAIVWEGPLTTSQTSAGVLDRAGNDLRIRAYGDTPGSGALAFRTGGGGGSGDTERMRIDSSGITTFKNDVLIDDGVCRLTLDSISGANRIMSTTTGFAAYEDLQFRADNYVFSTGTTERMRIDSSGVTSVYNDFVLDYASPEMYFKTGPTHYRWMLAAQENADAAFEITPSTTVGGSTYSTPVAVFKATGNVGIGTTSPSQKLHVSGNARVTGAYYDSSNGPGTLGQVLSSTATGTSWIDAAGGGGGSSTIYRQTFSGNNSTTVFTLSSTIVDEANTQVYIDGVYQSKLNYSASGTLLTFSTPPPTGTNNVEVINIAAITVNSTSGLIQNSFVGNGSTTAFTLSMTPTDENFTFVFIQGVYQDKSTYTVVGNTINFSTAPQSGYNVEVMSIGAVNIQQVSYLEYDNFTGNGSTTNYTLLNGSPSDEKFTMVYIQGVYQEKSTYSLSAGDIIFSTAPQSGYTIEIISVNGGGIQAAQSYTPVNAPKVNVEVISTNTTAAGHNYLYVFTASLTLTLPASPEVGDSIKISNRSGTTTCVLGRNGNNIMGSASDLTLDTASASFELIYSGAAQGWVIIGQ